MDGDAGAARPPAQFVRLLCTCVAHANMTLNLDTPISVMRRSVILVLCTSHRHGMYWCLAAEQTLEISDRDKSVQLPV